MQVVFVPVADRPECAKALKTAFDLGIRVDASVRGCHIRPHSDSDVSLPEDLGAVADHHDAAWQSAWKANTPILMLHT